MSAERELKKRSNECCELCAAKENLAVLTVHDNDDSADKSIYACNNCIGQINGSITLDENHWRCLNDSMWSQIPAVQVQAYRQLIALVKAGANWAQDLVDMLYLDEHLLEWANAGIPEEDDREPAFDSNGARLLEGDNVTLIKDLVVKGANFTAKRGTMVRGISLTQNPEHIEGKVNGTRIVLLTCYLKKQSAGEA